MDLATNLQHMNLQDRTTIDSVISNLYGDSRSADVRFVKVVGGREHVFVAHKIILSMWSPEFASKFYSDNARIDNAIRIEEDVSKLGFKCMLRYVYGRKITLTWETVLDPYIAAETYQITSLKNFCCSFIEKTTITRHNVCSLLEIAKHMNLTAVINECYRLIKNETSVILNTEAFLHCSRATVLSILRMQTLTMESEHSLIRRVIAWAQNCSASTHSSIRVAIMPLLPYLDISQLTPDQVTSIAEETPGIFTQKELPIIIMNLSGINNAINLPNWFNSDENFDVRTRRLLPGYELGEAILINVEEVRPYETPPNLRWRPIIF